MAKVSCYGLHKDPELNAMWLLEKDSNRNAVGLGPDRNPFKIESHHVKCPHHFEWDGPLPDEKFSRELQQWRGLPLIEYMMPGLYQPERHHVIVDDRTTDVAMTMAKLMELASPTAQMIGRLRPTRKTFDTYKKRIDGSNQARGVIVGIDTGVLSYVTDMIDASLGTNGRLFFAGDMSEFYAYKSTIERVTIPQELAQFLHNYPNSGEQLRRYGVSELRGYMRHA